MDKLIVFAFLVLATTLEATGDAIIRLGLGHNALAARLGLFAVGGALLLGYGLSLNLAPVEFNRGVGMYIATLLGGLNASPIKRRTRRGAISASLLHSDRLWGLVR